MGQLGLRVLKIKIPDTNRYEKEQTLSGKPFFRCTLLPPPVKLLKNSKLYFARDRFVQQKRISTFAKPLSNAKYAYLDEFIRR
jgi:hypothetical protein